MSQSLAQFYAHLVFSTKNRERTIKSQTYENLRAYFGGILRQGTEYNRFHWQNGYGAFSVSASKVDVVKRYVLNQEEHHRTANFQDEFRRFLHEYQVEYDERYVWD